MTMKPSKSRAAAVNKGSKEALKAVDDRLTRFMHHFDFHDCIFFLGYIGFVFFLITR